MLEQLLAHLWGDYLFQSDWMAQNKTKAHLPALVHALIYSALFLFLHPSHSAWFVIFITHFFIDRYRLARYVVWAKNWLGPKWIFAAEDQWRERRRNAPWQECKTTGYPPSCPPFMAVWLLIIADNTLHLTINYAALRWL